MSEKEFIANARAVLGEFFHTPCQAMCSECFLGENDLCNKLTKLAAMLEDDEDSEDDRRCEEVKQNPAIAKGCPYNKDGLCKVIMPYQSTEQVKCEVKA